MKVLLAFRDRKTDDRDEEELVLREKISHFIELLEEMRDLAVYTPVHELIQYILRKTWIWGLCKSQFRVVHREVQTFICLWKKQWNTKKQATVDCLTSFVNIEKLQKYEVDFGEVNLADAGNVQCRS